MEDRLALEVKISRGSFGTKNMQKQAAAIETETGTATSSQIRWPEDGEADPDKMTVQLRLNDPPMLVEYDPTPELEEYEEEPKLKRTFAEAFIEVPAIHEKSYVLDPDAQNIDPDSMFFYDEDTRSDFEFRPAQDTLNISFDFKSFL